MTCNFVIVALIVLLSPCVFAEPWQSIPLKNRVDKVQPMTGIVYWTDNEQNQTDTIQLEHSYMPYDQVIKRKGQYDWSSVDSLLNEVASRGHQAILRYHFVYPGKPTTVAAYIKAFPDYRETSAKSEGKMTGFPDWSHPELQSATLDFYTAFAARYDRDPRIAFLQTGFGLWAEYHIYDGPFELGKTFPSKAYQKRFLEHLSKSFVQTPWMISIDSADGDCGPFDAHPNLLKLPFGVFDDSFLCKKHAQENGMNWKVFGDRRYEESPAGGEFSYYTKKDQREALSPKGPNGVPFEKMATQYRISFMIGSDQPNYQTPDRIRGAGLAMGYRFRVTEFAHDESQTRAMIRNDGIAPIYHDAFAVINGTRTNVSLKGLLPGASLSVAVDSVIAKPTFAIASDRLVPGQAILYDADL